LVAGAVAGGGAVIAGTGAGPGVADTAGAVVTGTVIGCDVGIGGPVIAGAVIAGAVIAGAVIAGDVLTPAPVAPIGAVLAGRPSGPSAPFGAGPLIAPFGACPFGGIGATSPPPRGATSQSQPARAKQSVAARATIEREDCAVRVPSMMRRESSPKGAEGAVENSRQRWYEAGVAALGAPRPAAVHGRRQRSSKRKRSTRSAVGGSRGRLFDE
jgi:hypothetical protein